MAKSIMVVNGTSLAFLRRLVLFYLFTNDSKKIIL